MRSEPSRSSESPRLGGQPQGDLSRWDRMLFWVAVVSLAFYAVAAIVSIVGSS